MTSLVTPIGRSATRTEQKTNVKEVKPEVSNKPRPTLYVALFLTWAAVLWWFHPRLAMLLDMSTGPLTWTILAFFIGFIEFAWLYGLYNIAVVVFALIYRFSKKREMQVISPIADQAPGVAILYTTCNDFVRESAESCVRQDYANYTVYMLDDSSDPVSQLQVDAFAAEYPDRVVVVRRPDRKAFKAGNMNHGLVNYATEEPFFAIADADEILPPDFLSRLAPVIASDPMCGFIQANHRANPNAESKLAKALGIGIDIHWKWYQPLRNKYGFVMFLGHGALLRRSCWEEIGGFPEIVSEDLGFAIRIRELGYRGRFVEDVTCYEDFPDTVRAFRVRHMKWTRGTCEFLFKETKRLIKAKKITWHEKLDILFPTLNLPLTLLYFLFMLNANLAIPYFFGTNQPLTFEMGGSDVVLPIRGLDAGFQVIFTPDFFVITLLTFFAPVFCFVLTLAHRPLRLIKFLCHSTTLYASLGPLSSVGVLSYLATGKAIFLVTGDNAKGVSDVGKKVTSWVTHTKKYFRELLFQSHPDQKAIQGFELVIGVLFAILCFKLFQISFFGMCLAFILLPVLHHVKWENKWMQVLVYLPFLIIVFGLSLGAMSAFGMMTVFFGYGFHF